MSPVWIINLAEETTDRKHLDKLMNQSSAEWFYSEINGSGVDSLDGCSLLLDILIKEGQQCYNYFQQNGLVITDFQICLIGNLAEESTRKIFHLLPLLIRDHLSKIIGETVNRGVEVTGILFVSHKSNHDSFDERKKQTLFLEEFNTLIKEIPANYYNQVIVFQENQRADKRFYPELNSEGLQELLFQIIIHIYNTETGESKIFDLIKDKGLFSLGVASIYYNNREHKDLGLHSLLIRLEEELKDPANISEEDSDMWVNKIFPTGNITVKETLERLRENCSALTISPENMEGAPNPHPVYDFTKAKLYISYYKEYLRFMPARAAEFAKAYSRLLYARLASKVSKNKEILIESYKAKFSQIGLLLQQDNITYPGFAQLKDCVENLKKRLEEEKKKVNQTITLENITVFDIPEYLKADYEKCKEASLTDSDKDILRKMKETLQSEPTTLALLSRCFLLGTISIFLIIPILRHLSPFIIDLGNVAENEFIWIIGLFLLPFIISGWRFSSHFKLIRNLKKELLAHALLNAQQKAIHELQKNTVDLYNQLIEECDHLWMHYDRVEKSVLVDKHDKHNLRFGSTLFNQSLIGGSFQGQKLLLDESIVEQEIRINSLVKKISVLKKQEYIQLLKEIFKEHNKILSSLLNDKNENSFIENINLYLEEGFVSTLKNKIVQKEDDIIPLLEYIYEKHPSSLDLTPLFQMAGVNGIITHTGSKEGLIIHSNEISKLFGKEQEYSWLKWGERSYLFATNWSKVESNSLDTTLICGEEIPIDYDVLPFSTKLVCIYAYYRKKENRYVIKNTLLSLSHDELDKLDHGLKNIKI